MDAIPAHLPGVCCVCGDSAPRNVLTVQHTTCVTVWCTEQVDKTFVGDTHHHADGDHVLANYAQAAYQVCPVR